MSPHLALGPDCSAGCIEVYGRCTEKHTKTKHMKKCLQEKERD